MELHRGVWPQRDLISNASKTKRTAAKPWIILAAVRQKFTFGPALHTVLSETEYLFG